MTESKNNLDPKKHTKLPKWKGTKTVAIVTDPVTGMKFEIVTYLQESENLVIPYKWR